jgi:hypothetical protein
MTVLGKGRTCLTSVVVTIKVGITCGQAVIVQHQPLQAVDHPWSWAQWQCDLIGRHHIADRVQCGSVDGMLSTPLKSSLAISSH